MIILRKPTRTKSEPTDDVLDALTADPPGARATHAIWMDRCAPRPAERSCDCARAARPCARLDGGITRDGGWDVAVGVRRPLQPAGWRAVGALRDALEDACGTDVAQG